MVRKDGKVAAQRHGDFRRDKREIPNRIHRRRPRLAINDVHAEERTLMCRGYQIMPRRKMKKERFLNLLKNRYLCPALSERLQGYSY
jgi:hypothetical protein